MFQKYRKWRDSGLREENGIVVAADMTQEWLLSWWWEHYSRHNQHPVSFVNLGLSEEKKAWCQERGELIPLYVPNIFVKEKEEIAPSLIQEWEAQWGPCFWENRDAWFKKPLACLQSPYLNSIWIDLDCEIRGSLTPLFDCAHHPSGIALLPYSIDNCKTQHSTVIYNGGVIVFRRNLPLIEEWADGAFERNGEFPGDQDLLSQIIAEKNLSICELPPLYNWSRCVEENPDALIYHWHGRHGKSAIQHQIWLAGQTD